MGMILYNIPSEATSIVLFNLFVTLTRVRGIDDKVRSLNDRTLFARHMLKLHKDKEGGVRVPYTHGLQV